MGAARSSLNFPHRSTWWRIRGCKKHSTSTSFTSRSYNPNYHRYPSTKIHPKVAGYAPEKQIIVVSLDGEENLRLIGAEQNPTSVECFVNGADSAQDFTPVPEGTLALPTIDDEGADRM